MFGVAPKQQNIILRYIIIVLITSFVGLFSYAFTNYFVMTQNDWPIPTMIVSALVVLLSPIWQTFVVNAPKLSVEITSIERKLKPDASVNIRDIPEFIILNQIIGNDIASSRREPTDKYETRTTLTIDAIKKLLNNAQQKLDELPAQIDHKKKTLKVIDDRYRNKLTRYDAEVLSIPLDAPMDYNSDNPNDTLAQILRAHEIKIKATEKEYGDLTENVPVARAKLKDIINEYLATRSYFLVSVALINSGRYNTAIRSPALLRVYIGASQHVDLELQLEDFQTKSEVGASGTRNVVFYSDEIHSLPESNRSLVNRYWNSDNISGLFLEDIYNKKHVSNYIVFADGLYRKHVYEKLAYFADRIHKNSNPRLVDGKRSNFS